MTDGEPTELEPSDGPLPAGRYTTDRFGPRITLTLPEGWHARQFVDGFFDVQQNPDDPDVVAVQFAAIDGAHGRDGSLVGVATAAACADALAANEGLIVHAPRAGRVAGLPALLLDVDLGAARDGGAAFAPVVHVQAGSISIGPGRRLRLILVDAVLDDALLGILVGGSIAGWPAAEEAAEPVLASVRIA